MQEKTRALHRSECMAALRRRDHHRVGSSCSTAQRCVEAAEVQAANMGKPGPGASYFLEAPALQTSPLRRGPSVVAKQCNYPHTLAHTAVDVHS